MDFADLIEEEEILRDKMNQITLQIYDVTIFSSCVIHTKKMVCIF